MITRKELYELISNEHPNVFDGGVSKISYSSTFFLTNLYNPRRHNYFFRTSVFTAEYQFKLQDSNYKLKMKKWLYNYLKTIMTDIEFKVIIIETKS